MSRSLTISFTTHTFVRLSSQQVHARRVCTFVSATRDGMTDPMDRIGFGRYQWQLFVLCGLGWLADSEMSCLLAPGTRADMTQ